LAEGAKQLYIHKQPVTVRARVVQMNGLSGHADYHELLHWLESIKAAPRRVFVTHGEEEQSAAMADHLVQERGWECYRPELNETVQL
jgi:metallo-beta-lactamase family protein